MRYHYQTPDEVTHMYGEMYLCNHPVYNECTLFRIGDKGLAVVQQRCQCKLTYWGYIDDELADQIYLHPKFLVYFEKHAKENDRHGLYPTVTIRQVMWALRMKPLKKQRWETCFDRQEI